MVLAAGSQVGRGWDKLPASEKLLELWSKLQVVLSSAWPLFFFGFVRGKTLPKENVLLHRTTVTVLFYDFFYFSAS